ncbi:major facilitator transporter [Calothrix sp. NIES-4071]|nr:major facilitator transporter [Calothrix sp. NIES-4071]BAZ54586.1 major facilitator transporter [Calothrix sp. NIES-4105]
MSLDTLDSQNDDYLTEITSLPIHEISEDVVGCMTLPTILKPGEAGGVTHRTLKISKPDIRTSLKALTVESIFATVFYSIISGALLSNFLLELGAGAVEIGLLGSIPQLVNLLQPAGAYLINRNNSFRWFTFNIFASARLLWFILVPAIWLFSSGSITGYQVVQLTLVVICVTNVIEALGRAPWSGWTAILVPQKLRGRYFGFRNSLLSLTGLIVVPLLGFAVSAWPGGTLQGFGAVLILGIVFGLTSLFSQFLMADVNPQLLKATGTTEETSSQLLGIDTNVLKDANFLKFALYLGIWCFAVNVSAPFFNLYMLDDLGINISVVTIYNGLGAGANLLMLRVWGKLADKIGNRPLLLLIGILVAVTPVLWILTARNEISFWVWLPFLHLLTGATWAAIDLCTNNMIMGVAPLHHQSSYFGFAGAIAGVTGAIGITVGSFIAKGFGDGGLLVVFAFSGLLRLVALLPLVYVQEKRSIAIGQLFKVLFPDWKKADNVS